MTIVCVPVSLLFTLCCGGAFWPPVMLTHLPKLDEAAKEKKNNKWKTQMSCWHWEQKVIKAILDERNRGGGMPQRTITIRRNKDGNQRAKRQKGMNECLVQSHQGHWQLLAGVLNLLNVNKCLPCVLICFLLFFYSSSSVSVTLD